jgi:hypothetical protein
MSALQGLKYRTTKFDEWTLITDDVRSDLPLFLVLLSPLDPGLDPPKVTTSLG